MLRSILPLGFLRVFFVISQSTRIIVNPEDEILDSLNNMGPSFSNYFGSFLNRMGYACIGQIIRMGADTPIPPDTIERRRPSNGRPRGGFSDNKY